MIHAYLKDVSTLKLASEKCVGCGVCTAVCPHRVFAMNGGKAQVANKNRCMECGACALNCPAEAISVEANVGCASAIIRGWLTGTEPSCDCSGGCCDTDNDSSGSPFPSRGLKRAKAASQFPRRE